MTLGKITRSVLIPCACIGIAFYSGHVVGWHSGHRDALQWVVAKIEKIVATRGKQ